MKLKVKQVTFPEVIEFNFEELQKGIAEKVEHYKCLVYTENQVKDAKNDVANLRKFAKALSDERIRIKKQCLEAYTPFEEKINKLVAMIDEPINLIANQVHDYEEKQKEEKLDLIKNHWNSCTLPFETLQLEQIFNSKWLNASVNIKNVCKEIDERLEQIASDLSTLANLPDFSFEAVEVYKQTLNLNEAISEGKRLADMQTRKAEAQQKMEESFEKMKTAAETAAESVAEVVNATESSPAQWVSFKAFMTVEQALMLKDFFDGNNIKFTSI